jgi:SAM-dependent methyltransferase
MDTKQRLRTSLVRQFHNPTGPGGHLAGWIMGHRSSNLARNRWAVDRLDVQRGERVLELGCGPGVALAALAERAVAGLVVGVDHSSVMIRQASRRNARAVGEGRVHLVHAAVEDLPPVDERSPAPFDALFDAALAVNSVGFWADPVGRLAQVRRRLRVGGRIALVSQPRCPGATAATSRAAGTELAGLLAEAGFSEVHLATLELDPPAVCAQATNAG